MPASPPSKTPTSGARILGMHRSSARLMLMAFVGVLAGLAVAVFTTWDATFLVGWAAACATFCLMVLPRTLRMDAEKTRAHATADDPSRGATDALVLTANVASLVAVGFTLVHARKVGGVQAGVLAGIVVASVALSWCLLHTLYLLRYAMLYYGDKPGGIDFNSDDPPCYSDFAYVAFTMGMTYQVSDTDLQTHAIRSTVLRHGLLSYVFGSVILATTINLVVSLAS